ncbi:efflux RND transporter permease subunit [Candidatus Laterigemmans baculatus]|uniref:efflux RND transporter permease subunit n=1 Tax=Candidatus Laterigemmans baculatus TaxID=2770505 RepID=UPI0013DB62A9|nr:efflux RND transporter permease subunit [Candidatus Laterigemmans baculatus]
MSIAAGSVEKSTIVGFSMLLLVLGGIGAFFALGQLEDPEFTIKNATVSTTYPGASAEEVELEVTDRIEIAIQEMAQVEKLESVSRPGFSSVKVEILPQYPAEQLPQIWDELRRKVSDVTPSLPPGSGIPVVGDDFGDVYGFLLAVTADGFSYEELESRVDDIKKELSLVPGVARVELWGVPTRCIYLDVSEGRLAQLGLTMEEIQRTLTEQNLVVNSGGFDLNEERIRIDQTGDFTSPENIADLTLRGRSLPEAGAAEELLRLGDVAEVRRGLVEPPTTRMRFKSRATGDASTPTIGLAISNQSGENVVTLGKRLDAALADLQTQLPTGIEVHKISWQSDQVDESIDVFVISLIESVAIVVAVLWIFMGFWTASVVGLSGLLLTIIGTFLCMAILGIDLQRMSLGALVIAMGMMVDNAIVVADGVLVRLQRGMGRRQAAIEAATQPAWPLLGATLIAVIAFYPIYASEEGAGEYCASLFQVVAIALIISWILSVTATPLLCIWMLPDPKTAGSGEIYSGKLFAAFRGLLERAIRWRWAVVVALVAALAGALSLFPFIDKTFFPDSARLQLMVDYWAPEGTNIDSISRDMERIETHLLADEAVESVSSFIGAGPPRFYLPVEPEAANPSYGQFIVNVRSLDDLNRLVPELNRWLKQNVPQAEPVIRRYGLGPSNTWSVELRVAGPGTVDTETLRNVANGAVEIMEGSPYAEIVRTNWRQKTKKIVADYAQERARWTGVTRSDIAAAAKRAYDGLSVGQYREGDKLYPILARHIDSERRQFPGQIDVLQVHPALSPQTVPLSQVIDTLDVQWEEAQINRFNRRRTITVQARTPDGVPASRMREDILPQIEAYAAQLPPGFRVEWGGEYEDSRDSQQSLIPGMIPAVLLMALILVSLFNAFRPPLIIVAVVPFALIGVTIGLLVVGQPLGFVALLGVMSLSGMMIKNAIVLLDEINAQKASGKSDYDAVVHSALSRLRPVGLAAGTTVLGVIPLLQDVFWVSMAVAIMFGLALGAGLTVLGVPVLYAAFYRIPSPSS